METEGKKQVREAILIAFLTAIVDQSLKWASGELWDWRQRTRKKKSKVKK